MNNGTVYHLHRCNKELADLIQRTASWQIKTKADKEAFENDASKVQHWLDMARENVRLK